MESDRREIEVMMVPQRIDRRVKYLLSKLSSIHPPVYIPVSPELYARVNDCFVAMRQKVDRDGGTIVCGWQIWQTPLITEAEYHAVWRSPEGILLDITPKMVHVKNILFVEDDTIEYDGSQVDNIRINNTSNTLVDDLISVNEALFYIMNKGSRSKIYHIELEGQELVLFKYLKDMQFNLEMFVYRGADSGSPCFCGRTLPYYQCHGHDLSKALSTLKKRGD